MPQSPHRFTPEEDAVIRRLWSTKTSFQIGIEIGRKPETVRIRGRRLGMPPKVVRVTVRTVQPSAEIVRPDCPDGPVNVRTRTGDVRRPPPLSATEKAERKAAADATAVSVRRRIETLLHEHRSASSSRCICGRPGNPHCAAHRRLLQREGVL